MPYITAPCITPPGLTAPRHRSIWPRQSSSHHTLATKFIFCRLHEWMALLMAGYARRFEIARVVGPVATQVEHMMDMALEQFDRIAAILTAPAVAFVHILAHLAPERGRHTPVPRETLSIQDEKRSHSLPHPTRPLHTWPDPTKPRPDSSLLAKPLHTLPQRYCPQLALHHPAKHRRATPYISAPVRTKAHQTLPQSYFTT